MFFNITKVNGNPCASLQYHSRKLIFMHGTSLTAQDTWEPNLFAITDFKPGSNCLYVPYLYGYECKWDFRAAINVDFQQITCSEHKASAQFVWYAFKVLFYFVIFGAQQHPSSLPIIVWRREVWTLCYILPPVFHRRKKRKSHTVWINTVLSEFAVLAIPITLGLEFVNLTSASNNSVASVFKYCTLLYCVFGWHLKMTGGCSYGLFG